MTGEGLKAHHEELLASYDAQAGLYSDFTDFLVAQLGSALYASGIKCHAIDGRLKSRSSLYGKLVSGKKQYSELGEITDIAGVRITTYFARDVDKVASTIAPIFEVDAGNSVDRRTTIDSDRFGYLSLHFIVLLKQGNTPSGEKYQGLKAEVQVRSILQHAWAEIEHDLGYKYPGGVPRHIRRKFSTAASLLETADEKFDEIRDEVSGYVTNLPAKIETHSALVRLDTHSLAHLIGTHRVVQDLDLRVAQLVGASLSGEMALARILLMLNLLQIDNAQTFITAVETHASEIVSFASEWFARSYSGNVVAINAGTSILFFFYHQIAKGQDVSKVIGLLRESGVSDRLVADLAGRILSVAGAMV